MKVIPPQVSEIKLITTAYPTQWKGKTTDGRFIYIRYRHSYLTVSIGQTFNLAVENHCNGKNIFACERTFASGGIITYQQLKSITQHTAIKWPEEEL